MNLYFMVDHPSVQLLFAYDNYSSWCHDAIILIHVYLLLSLLSHCPSILGKDMIVSFSLFSDSSYEDWLYKNSLIYIGSYMLEPHVHPMRV